MVVTRGGNIRRCLLQRRLMSRLSREPSVVLSITLSLSPDTSSPLINHPSVPLLLKAAHSAAYWCVKSRTFCGRLVAWMILLTFTAPSSSINVRIVNSNSGLNSEYHLYCHVTSLMTEATVSLVFFSFSKSARIPVRALGEKRIERHARYASTASL